MLHSSAGMALLPGPDTMPSAHTLYMKSHVQEMTKILKDPNLRHCVLACHALVAEGLCVLLRIKQSFSCSYNIMFSMLAARKGKSLPVIAAFT